MSKEKVVVAGTNGISAQQMSEFFRQMGEGKIDGRVMQSIIEHRNPWPYWKDDGNKVISFDLTSNGMTGSEWITHFETKSLFLSECVKSILLSKDFMPSEVGKVHHVGVIKGSWFIDGDRTTECIALNAKMRASARTPSAELACLICDNFTKDDLVKMRFGQIVVLHEPILDSEREPCILGFDGSTIKTHHVSPNDVWAENYGFGMVW